MAEKDIAKEELIKALDIAFKNGLREDCWIATDWEFVTNILNKAIKT